MYDKNGKRTKNILLKKWAFFSSFKCTMYEWVNQSTKGKWKYVIGVFGGLIKIDQTYPKRIQCLDYIIDEEEEEEEEEEWHSPKNKYDDEINK